MAENHNKCGCGHTEIEHGSPPGACRTAPCLCPQYVGDWKTIPLPLTEEEWTLIPPEMRLCIFATFDDLRAQVARLEGEKDAAQKIVDILRPVLNLNVVQVPPPIQDKGRLYALKDAVNAFAALSDTAGEGWLEVREQADGSCKHYRRSYWRGVNRYCGDCDKLIDSGAGWSPAH